MYKIVILLLTFSSLVIFAKVTNSPKSNNKVFVSLPVTNGAGGNIEKTNPLKKAERELAQAMNESNSKSYTGLSLEEEEQILSSIDEKNIEQNEGDTLWMKISKAYIRVYPKLFMEKN